MTELAADNEPYCSGFWPGHNVHWIHARHGAETERFAVTGLTVEGGWVSFTANGVDYRCWTHNAWVIDTLLERKPDAVVDYCARWRLLFVETDGPNENHGRSSAMFYLDTKETDCRGGKPTGPITEIRVNDDESHRRV